jgi:hypothetical protein
MLDNSEKPVWKGNLLLEKLRVLLPGRLESFLEEIGICIGLEKVGFTWIAMW